MLPKIKFRRMSLQENIDIIKWAYFFESDLLDIYGYTIYFFPELATIDKNESKEIINNKIEEIVIKKYNESLPQIGGEVSRYNKIWNIYNDKYFETLSKYLDIDWPKTMKIIDASIGIIPIFPRYLDNHSFSLSTDVSDKKLIEVCAHESLHFLWFEKWKKLYPTCPKEEFDSPYLPWQYSEMVTDPILNSQRIKSILNVEEKAYDSFYELKDNNDYVMNKLKNIYLSEDPIESKIIAGYEYLKNSKIQNK